MADILINKNDIKTIIESYKNEDDSFVIRSFIGDDNKKRCTFFLKGRDCIIDIYIKKNIVKILPIGKNIDESNKLIEYISKRGFSANTDTKQFTFFCTKQIVDSLVGFIQDECVGLVECNQVENIYRFTGYNNDIVTFSFYASTNKAMIQGRPFQSFGIITTFLAGLTDFSYDKIIDMNNAFVGINTPTASIRLELQNRLEESYIYLDEALLKSISGSLTLLKQRVSSEDYSGCLAGCFKGLEGYLGKILINKYGYKLRRKEKFGMFYVDRKTRETEINNNNKIPDACKIELHKLYSIYQNKRNVYLHATVDPSQTSVIASYEDAKEIADTILNSIRDSYRIFIN